MTKKKPRVSRPGGALPAALPKESLSDSQLAKATGGLKSNIDPAFIRRQTLVRYAWSKGNSPRTRRAVVAVVKERLQSGNRQIPPHRWQLSRPEAAGETPGPAGVSFQLVAS